MLDMALRGRASVTWVDHSYARVSNLRQVVRLGIPAVVSVTEYRDLDSHYQLLDLGEVAQSAPFIYFIVLTKQWTIQGADHSLSDVRRLARMTNVNLGVICGHQTGVPFLKGATPCWDYSQGTPLHEIQIDKVKKGYSLLGTCDWLTRAKMVASIATSKRWYDFD